MKLRIRHTAGKSLLIMAIVVALVPHVLQCRQPFFQDEWVINADVLRFFGDRTIIPHHKNYPTLYPYLVSPFIGANAVTLKLSGEIRSFSEIPILYSSEPLKVVWPARAFTVLALLACALIVGAFVAHRHSRLAGLAAGGALLVTPALLRYGAYGLPDVTTMLFAALALLQALRIAEFRKGAVNLSWQVALGGLLAGLATASKYNGAVAIIPVLVAIGLVARGNKLSLTSAMSLFAVAGVAMVGGFLVGCPGWLLVPHSYWTALRSVQLHMATGHTGASGVPLLGQLELMVRSAPVLSMAALVAILAWSRRTDRAGWVAVSLIVATLILTANAQKQSLQFLFPLFPAAAFFIGTAVHTWSHRKHPKTVVLVIAVAAIIPVAMSWTTGVRYLRPNSTELARQWIYHNIPVESTVAVDWDYVPKLYSRERISRLRQFQSRFGQAGLRVVDELAAEVPLYDVLSIQYSIDWLHETDAEFLVTSSGCYKRFFTHGVFTSIPSRPDSPIYEGFRKRRIFYETLFNSHEWQEVYRVDTGNGPETVMYRRVSAAKPSGRM